MGGADDPELDRLAVVPGERTRSPTPMPKRWATAASRATSSPLVGKRPRSSTGRPTPGRPWSDRCSSPAARRSGSCRGRAGGRRCGQGLPAGRPRRVGGQRRRDASASPAGRTRRGRHRRLGERCVDPRRRTSADTRRGRDRGRREGDDHEHQRAGAALPAPPTQAGELQGRPHRAVLPSSARSRAVSGCTIRPSRIAT